jgi:hypothetical protein
MKQRSLTRDIPRTLAAAQRALASAQESFDWYVENGVMIVTDDVGDFSEYDRLERAVELARQQVAWFETRAAA